MKVLSNHHPEHTFRHLEPREAAAMLEKKHQNRNNPNLQIKKPGGALNKAPDSVRNLATLMLRGNCD
jgi:hypothetical protein